MAQATRATSLYENTLEELAEEVAFFDDPDATFDLSSADELVEVFEAMGFSQKSLRQSLVKQEVAKEASSGSKAKRSRDDADFWGCEHEVIQRLYLVCAAHKELIDLLAVYRDELDMHLTTRDYVSVAEDEVESDEIEGLGTVDEVETARDKLDDFVDKAENAHELYDLWDIFSSNDGTREFYEMLAKSLYENGVPSF